MQCVCGEKRSEGSRVGARAWVCVCVWVSEWVCVCVVVSLRDYFVSDTWAIARAFYIRKAVRLHYQQQRYANIEARPALHVAKRCHEGCLDSLLSVLHAEEYVPCRMYQFLQLHEHMQARNLFQPTDLHWPHITVVIVRPVSHYINQILFIELCCVMLAAWFVWFMLAAWFVCVMLAAWFVSFRAVL